MICAIMVSGALLPAVSSAIDDSRGYYNNDYISMAKVVGDESITIAYDGVNYSINDEIVIINSYTYVAISDRFVILVTDSGLSNIEYYSDSYKTATSVSSFEFIINDNVVDLSYMSGDTETTASFSIEWAYYVYTEGDYRLFKVDQYNSRDVYLNSIDDFVAVSYNSNGIFSLKNNTVMYNGNVHGEYYADLDKVSGVNGVYELLISTNIETSGFYFIDGSDTFTTQAFIVPYEVHGTKAGYEGVEQLFNVLPIIAVAGLIMAGIYVFINRK